MANISQQKRQKMLEFLNKLKEEHQDDASLRALGEIETALSEKKYGLVWEKHREKVDDMLEKNIPIFIEDKSKKIFFEDSVHGGVQFSFRGRQPTFIKIIRKNSSR